MTTRNVTTQQELDAALADASVKTVNIDSPAGVWLEISEPGRRYVEVRGSASVSASGSASVSAYGSASVSASGSASVRAYGSASVSAYDSASVSASKFVAVHLHSKRVTLDGGVVIDVTEIEKHSIAAWCEWQGVDIDDGHIVVYQAVDQDLKSGYGFHYPIGKTVTDKLWSPTDGCGAGLHFGASPAQAEAYFNSPKPRFLACRVAVVDAVGITGQPDDTAKMKARGCEVLFEVDVHGRQIGTVAAAA